MAEPKQTVSINFFDDSNQTPIYLEDPKLRMRPAGSKEDWIRVDELEVEGEESKQVKAKVREAELRLKEAHADLEEAKPEKIEEAKLKVEKAKAKLQELRAKAEEVKPKLEKGSQSFEIPARILDAREGKKPLIAELSLAEEVKIGCNRYAPSTVSFLVKEEAGTEYCCIPFPLHKLAETCSIKFTAADTSKDDLIRNAKAFEDNVKWTVTAVRGPAMPSQPGTARASTAKFQPFTETVTSVDGVAEIFDVPFHALYQIETSAPEGYFCEQPTLQYCYICCEPKLEIKNSFKPCGKRPTRSAVFVQQKCQGIRWGKSKVVIAGREEQIDENGILHIDKDLNGVFPISAPGKSFTPSSLDLREGAPLVSTIAVSDQPVTASGRIAEGYLVDSANKPFVGRRMVVLLPNGDEVEVTTDSSGRFEAPYGSTVYAREDEWGMETDRVLLTESI